MTSREIASLLNKQIKESEVYLNYLKYKNIITNKYDIKALDTRYRGLQKEIVSNYNEDSYQEYLKLKDIFDNDEDLLNYLNAKDKLNKMLQTIFQVINDNI